MYLIFNDNILSALFIPLPSLSPLFVLSLSHYLLPSPLSFPPPFLSFPPFLLPPPSLAAPFLPLNTTTCSSVPPLPPSSLSFLIPACETGGHWSNVK